MDNGGRQRLDRAIDTASTSIGDSMDDT